jgi:4-amino-4-deoxy-L-arabinose transferase-like glycosyltransferase
MTARTRTDILLLAGFCAFLFFYGLGQFGLIGADEPRYAQVAREMMERGDWITPTLGGHPWLEKPPLYYWEAGLVYRAIGVSDVAARIPSAFDASLLVVAIYVFFRKFRRGVEVDAALITASCAGMIGYARAASTDMPLASAFCVGMLAWWAWRESGKREYLLAFYALMALGMLAKGPVAPFLAGLVVVLFSLVVREPRLILRTLWIPGILLFCAIGLPWYVAVQMRNPLFFHEFILEHNLARFSSNVYHHPEPFWYYLPVAALALLPWTAFAVVALVESLRVWWTERKSEAGNVELQFRIFAVTWLLVPIIFFSLSQSKLPGYILPAIPAAAVLLGDYLLRHSEKPQALPKWLVVLHALLASSPIVPAVLIAYAVTQHRLPGGRPMFIAVVIAFLLCVAITLTLVRRHLRMFRFVTLVPVVLSVAAVLKLGTTAIDLKLSARPLAMDLASVETKQLPIAVYGVPRELEYGLAFYRNQPVQHYESGNMPAGEHLLVAPTTWMHNVVQETAGRHVTLLGHYAPQGVDYYYIAAAGSKP